MQLLDFHTEDVRFDFVVVAQLQFVHEQDGSVFLVLEVLGVTAAALAHQIVGAKLEAEDIVTNLLQLHPTQ